MSNDIGDLIRNAWREDKPAGWFEPLYAKAARGEGHVPWARMQPFPLLIDWLDNGQIQGRSQKALVVGCGLGDDAEALSEQGFEVTAFDISQTAIDWCKTRFPDSKVDYQVADLLNLPENWQAAFDLVLEIYTIQSLPYQFHPQVIEALASLVKQQGTLLVICIAREPHQPYKGIPWTLSIKELSTFTQFNLIEKAFDDYTQSPTRQFRVEYSRSK